MNKIRILWVDDEIDLLKLHILFLEEKGYDITTTNNGDDALSLVHENHFDIIFLDENMPGLSGLETLDLIKSMYPLIPIVMITKNDEENIMDRAIGAKISDYLIKPVKPNQVLLTIKKNVDTKRLITAKTTADYREEFSKLGIRINEAYCFKDWVDIYKKLVYWELELDSSDDTTMDEILLFQKEEANNAFTKYIAKNYTNWFDDKNQDKPMMLPKDIIGKKILPLLNSHKVVLIVIDNLRYDQWQVLQPLVREYYQVDEELIYSSILPTTTSYARNSLFSGLMPAEIAKRYPQYWLTEKDEGSKNKFEKELLIEQLKRKRIDEKVYYAKIVNNKSGDKLVNNFDHILQHKLSVLVYNFVDMISHALTEMKMLKELANDEKSYRSLTYTWFEHSSLLEMLKKLSNEKVKVIITTDHGTIRVTNPVKVIGKRDITTNLRYKEGSTLKYNEKEVPNCYNPADIFLPQESISSKYIFAAGKDFLAYPNNFNHYVKYYKDTFQHGGISLEEMLIPYIQLKPKYV